MTGEFAELRGWILNLILCKTPMPRRTTCPGFW